MEDFSVEHLVAEPRVEALAVSVLPREPGLNVGPLGPDGGDPVLYRLGNELRTFVGPDERRGTTQVEIAQSPLARDALAEAAARLSQLAHDARRLIEEIDVNPVIVTLDSAVAVDVLITPRDRGQE